MKPEKIKLKHTSGNSSITAPIILSNFGERMRLRDFDGIGPKIKGKGEEEGEGIYL